MRSCPEGNPEAGTLLARGVRHPCLSDVEWPQHQESGPTGPRPFPDLGARTLLGAPGRTTRSKKLLGALGIATRSKDATRNKNATNVAPGIATRYERSDRTL